jgi:hypothetical protein
VRGTTRLIAAVQCRHARHCPGRERRLAVLSRSRPSGPSSAKRYCQRQTTTCAPHVCVAGCDPTRSPQAAFRPTCSTKRILSEPSTQIRMPEPSCESAECVSALA